MKRLRLNGRVGGIPPDDRPAIAAAERNFKTKLIASQLNERLARMNEERPEGSARIAGAFRATQPRGGNLLRDPNDLTATQMEEVRRANERRGALPSTPAKPDPEPPPVEFHTQDEILEAIGKGFLKDFKDKPEKRWRNVVLGVMTNLATLCRTGQNLPQLLLTARRLDEAGKSAESEGDEGKEKDIRAWLLEE